jgi:hypothetical protein
MRGQEIRPDQFSVAMKKFTTQFKAFGEFLKMAQKKDIIREDLDPQILVWDFFGLMTNAMRNETVLKIFLKRNKIKTSEDNFLKESPRRILDLIFKGALK